MDLLGLFGNFVHIIKSVHAQYETYCKLQDAKRESLAFFQRAVSRLTDDLRMYQKFIETLHEHEHQPFFAKFINSTGLGPYQAFESAVINAKDRCRELTLQEQSSLAPERKGVTRKLAASAIFSDTLANSTKRVDAATADLMADIDSIERAYRHFYALYILYEMSCLRAASPKPSLGSSTRAQAIDAVVSAFYRNPLCLSTKRVSVNTLLKLNQNREVAELVTEVMKKEGGLWAEGPDDLGTIDNLSRIQTRLMELLWFVCMPQMESDALQFARGVEEERMSNVELKELGFGLKSAIARAKTQSFSIAFCGMVKAGKSLFLNALVGRNVLPSDELPSTAWPCRLRHVPRQSVPKLSFDPAPFQVGLAKLRARKFGSKMQDYKPPADDPFADILSDQVPDPAPSEDLARIYYDWTDLHKQTRANLLKFEHPDFELPSYAEGGDQVAKLLGQLNDIVRLCHRFKLGFALDSGGWPLLSIEFESLRDRHVEGIFEFIDLPGLGEQFDNFDFEEMIIRVANYANAVVPIVSFKEIAKQDWRKLPRIISSGLQTRASMVICTHFDQISKNNIDEQLANVTKIFWPDSPAATDRVIPCSSNMGLSAATLLRHSAESLPSFDDIWVPDSVGYLCAKTILGVGNPSAAYGTFNLPHWRAAVEMQWHKSGLPNALRRLTSDLVAQAKQRILISESTQLCKQVRKINNGQQRVLLEMRRSRDELEAAREEFQRARAEFTNTLELWGLEERRRDRAYDAKLRQSVERLQTIGNQSVQKALQETRESMSEMFSHEASNPIEGTSSSLFIGSRQQAEDFLRASQQRLTALLLELKHQFVSTVRVFAGRANGDRVENLRQAIRAFKSDMEAELRGEMLVDLESLIVNVRALAFHTIQKGLKTERVRYSPAEMYKIFEDAVARPILSLQDDIGDDQSPEVTVQDLGFVVRAPITIIATVPFVLSAGVWMFMTKTKKYHCDLSVLANYYQEKIVTPFLQDLEAEGSKSLKSALTQSSAVAKATVEYALQREDARYERESKEKDNMPPKEQVAELVAAHLNFVAAEGAFLSLKSHLGVFVSGPGDTVPVYT